MQRGTCLYDPELDAPLPVETPPPLPGAVRRAVDMLLQARRPLILAGGGVVIAGAAEELRALAEHLQVPVQVTLMGKGAFPEDHELFAGMAGIQTQTRWGNAAFLESDLVLAVGARFGDRHTGDLDTYRKGRRFVHVDIEPTQIGRVFEPDLGVVGHARPALAAMAEEARRRTDARTAGRWPRRVAELRRTLLRRDDFDDVPIKPPGSSARSTTSSVPTRRSSPRSACTRSGRASSRRPTCPGVTWSADRRGRWAGRSPPRWASSAPTRSAGWWPSRATTPSSS
nr:hypothetical protein GCM10020093_107120 [Planobispora longispora]